MILRLRPARAARERGVYEPVTALGSTSPTHVKENVCLGYCASVFTSVWRELGGRKTEHFKDIGRDVLVNN